MASSPAAVCFTGCCHLVTHFQHAAHCLNVLTAALLHEGPFSLAVASASGHSFSVC
jgi:hypothetical protein